MARVDVVVVGAGTTGAVVAARLTEQGRDVLLLEAGPPPDPAPGFDPFASLASGARTWAGLVATHAAGATPQPYWQGRGVGGTSAVNGMMAVWGQAEDYDDWNCPGWSWAELQPARRRVEATFGLRRNDHLGPLNQALGDVAPAVPGTAVERPRFTVNETGRLSVAAAYGAVARTDAEVDLVLLDGRRAVGVRLVGGEEIEAATVVLSAGAVFSPTLLLRSGVDRDGIGNHLLDHPASRVVVHLTEAGRVPDRHRLPFGVLLRAGPVQLTPMDYTDDLATGGVTVALMEPHSSGTVGLDGDRPVVDLHQLADDRDRRQLVAGVDLVERLFAQPGMPAVVARAEWPRPGELGDVFHAAGTCRMGAGDADAVVDPDGRVIGYEGLFVADASIMPVLPTANPMLTCVLIGERLAERWDRG